MQTLGEMLNTLVWLVVLGVAIGVIAWLVRRSRSKLLVVQLKRHFAPTPLDQLAVTERQFPPHIRADLQHAIEGYVGESKIRLFTGLKNEAGLGGVDFPSLMDERLTQDHERTGPPQYEQIDIGEDEPVQALVNGLWLLEHDGCRFAVLYSPYADYGGCGITQRLRFQLAAPNADGGAEVANKFFKILETEVLNAKCYRGKVLSFDAGDDYSGQSSGVKVHRLTGVRREDVILPEQTVQLLERNVIDFVRRRDGLGGFQMATKKGLLFYGPPGTGKTHTIRYLASSLTGHTTLLISAEQVELLGEYMTLARLLQPSIVIIEDVDLIARDRARMHSAQSELLLNKLLNEMDGLREDARILFILTTNRPEELEGALASRPGRIDQAIEFPLPDSEGRAKLVRLYSGGLTVSDELAEAIASRTEKVSASFIKELMRRAAQFHLDQNGTRTLTLDDVQSALDEMLFHGGSLNLKLLGAEQRIGYAAGTL